jgi:hypothetical protein
MKNKKTIGTRLLGAGITAGLAVVTALCFHLYSSSDWHLPFSSGPEKQGLTPWQCVGGCGESSGSASSDLQLKWIGKGVTGALIDMDMTFSQSILADTAKDPAQKFDGALRLKITSLLMNIYCHPRGVDFKLALPFLIKKAISK